MKQKTGSTHARLKEWGHRVVQQPLVHFGGEQEAAVTKPLKPQLELQAYSSQFLLGRGGEGGGGG